MTLRIKKTVRRKRRNSKYKTQRQKGGNTFEVFYDNQKIAGQQLPRNQTQSPPSIKFPTTGKLYTVIMWDPDVPPQAQPGFVHWIAINIKSPNDILDNQLIQYKGPAPPSGIHRYFFGLFEQQTQINPRQPERQKFNIQLFVKDNNLTKIYEVFMMVSYVNV
jgi:phosphatidylethanolamine-binding protein (PEBP) family uncharacterized protein